MTRVAGYFVLRLTSIHIVRMVFHMKTTLNVDETVMRRLKEEAARRGKTMSELVEAALRMFLLERPKPKKLPRLPTFKGGILVDVANRDALEKAMGEEEYFVRRGYKPAPVRGQ